MTLFPAFFTCQGLPSQLLGLGRSSVAIVLVDVDGLPRVADPLVADGPGGQIPAVGDVIGKSALLRLVLVLFV